MTKLPKPLSKAEETLALQLRAAGIPHQREVQLIEGRKWRSDFLVDGRLVVEVEGITYGGGGGRHQRGAGFEKDIEKYEHIMLAGWPLYRVTPERVQSGRALHVIERMLA